MPESLKSTKTQINRPTKAQTNKTNTSHSTNLHSSNQNQPTTKHFKDNTWLVLGFIFLAIWTRLIPHIPNVTALGATALLAGFKVRSKTLALVIPLAAMIISDYVIGFHNTMIWSYLGFSAVVIGSWGLIALAKKFSWTRLSDLNLTTSTGAMTVIGGAAFSSTLFFLISNLGVWMSTSLYTKTAAGLAQCYFMALPFWWNQFLGDTAYFGGFLALLALLQHYLPSYKAVAKN